MPILATMGLKKIYIAPAMTDGSMPAKGNQWLDLGDVYQDTCNLKDDSPEITEHKSETSSKVITLVGETPTNVELSLMDPDLELLARYFGGTIAGERVSALGFVHENWNTRNGRYGFNRKRACLSGVPMCVLSRHSRLLILQGYLPCAYDYQVPIQLASR